MRIWRTGDGGTLVERSGGSFVLFALSGVISNVFEPWGSSDSDGICNMSHAVEGSELVQLSDYEPDRGDNRRTSSVVVRGLVGIAAEDCTVPLGQMDGLVTRFKAERGRR
jgi:hypothetical protein